MKPQEKIFWEILSVVVVIVYLLSVIQNIQSEQKVEAMLQPGPIPKARSYSQAQRAERMQHARALYAIWQARHERDVAAEVAPFLHDKYDNVETSAVRVLVRLKTPTAKNVLQQYIENRQREWNLPMNASSSSFDLALSRAQPHDLNIWAKFFIAARSVDLSFDEVTMLFAKINEKGRIGVATSRGYYIMEELIDLLADSARDGENIEPIVNQLILAPAYQVKLKAATLSAPEGIRMILDYNAVLLSDVDALTTDLIVQKLTELLQKRGKIAHYRELFEAAAQTNDARMIPLLRDFQNHPDAKICYEAIMFREAMERQTLYPPLP